VAGSDAVGGGVGEDEAAAEEAGALSEGAADGAVADGGGVVGVGDAVFPSFAEVAGTVATVPTTGTTIPITHQAHRGGCEGRLGAGEGVPGSVCPPVRDTSRLPRKETVSVLL